MLVLAICLTPNSKNPLLVLEDGETIRKYHPFWKISNQNTPIIVPVLQNYSPSQ
jgi:hypothetical protein